MREVRVRFAPSPTGFVHIGSLRTALYNYLYAKKMGGSYILRIEDTDQSRLVDGAIDNMLSIFEWAGIKNDEGVIVEDGKIKELGNKGPYIQSQRLDIYKKYIEELLENGYAYYCFCTRERVESVKEGQKERGETPKYDGFCRDIPLEEARKRAANGEPHVIRLKFPENKDISFNDVVRGNVVINTNDIDDQVLMKSDGFPTYHFAVVVDDHLMDITHVIRGEEWVPSTPKHVFLYEAFGWEAPTFVHLPNILNKHRKKLSKRHDSAAVSDFRDKGYLRDGLINYLSLVGWSPEGEKEIFSMEELIEEFSLERISKSGGIFDVDKLNYINNHYIKECDSETLAKEAVPFLIEAGYINENEVDDKMEWIKDLVDVFKDRLSNMEEIVAEAGILFKDTFEAEEEAKEVLKADHIGILIEALEGKLSEVDEIDGSFGKATFKAIQKETGYKGKDLYMPVRAAITGEVHGPDMGLILKLLGKDRVIARLEFAKSNLI